MPPPSTEAEAALAFRFAPLNADAAEAEEARTVRVSISSDSPVEMGDGLEVLEHRADCVDLRRAAAGLPLLREHDRTRPLGVVDGVKLQGGRLVGVARFGSSPEALEAWRDVQAGILRFLSVGYSIERAEHDERGVRRVTRWTPFEVSLVAIAADYSVGVNRAFPMENFQMTDRNSSAGASQPRNTASSSASSSAQAAASARSAAPTALERERERVADISAAAAQFADRVPDAPRIAAEAIQGGASVDAFRSRLLDAMGSSAMGPEALSNSALLGLSRRELRSMGDYSLARAIRAATTGDWRDAGLEREVGEEIEHRVGRSPQGVFVPSFALARRDLIDSTAASGMLGVDHLGSAFVDSLRPETAVLGLGATGLSGLRRDESIPKMTEGSTAQWTAEGSAPTESTPAFGTVGLSYRDLSAYLRYTRKTAIQGDPSLEALFRNDLRAEVARALDAAAIAGSGVRPEPTGILNTPGILEVPNGDNGGEMSWATVVGLISAVEGRNAHRGSLGFLTNALVKAFCMGTPRVAGTSRFILDDDDGGKLAGHKLAVSNLVPNDLTKGTGTDLSAMIFGNWRDLLIGEFGSMDLIVDPYTESTKGIIYITMLSAWDIAVRRTESFAVAKDIALA
jgi:hypothetical protein